jgi:hypothetical protein
MSPHPAKDLPVSNVKHLYFRQAEAEVVRGLELTLAEREEMVASAPVVAEVVRVVLAGLGAVRAVKVAPA